MLALTDGKIRSLHLKTVQGCFAHEYLLCKETACRLAYEN